MHSRRHHALPLSKVGFKVDGHRRQRAIAEDARACIVDCLTLILQNWDLGKRQIDSIGDALKVTLSDADANVRANSKSCFEILSVTSPTASDNVLARVDSKVARSLSSMTNDSESEASVDRRDRSSRGDVSSAPSRSASRASGANNFDKEVQGASKPPTPPSSTMQGVAAAVMFAERVERAAEVATRAEACAKLRNALEEADTRTHGAQVAKFEAQVTSHASRIVELLLGYMSDSDALVIDPHWNVRLRCVHRGGGNQGRHVGSVPGCV